MTVAAQKRSILVVAGEASADNYAADAIAHFRQLEPDPPHFFGIGGPRLRELGVEILFDAADLAVVGVTEVAEKLALIFKALRTLKKRLAEERPVFALLLDMPDFNLRVAKFAALASVPVLYYISPQLWAWRPGRIKLFERYVSKLLVTLPFEESWYRERGAGFDVEFVGHPLVERIKTGRARQDLRREIGVREEDRLIALLPGSRKGEVAALLPTLLQSAALIRQKFPQTRFVLPLASTLPSSFVKERLTGDVEIALVEGATYDVLSSADFAIVCSGTATLETALLGVPMIVIYRLSALSYWIGHFLIDTPYMGLVNIVAEQELCPELLQGEVTPEGVAEAAITILEDSHYYHWLRASLLSLREKLGGTGASLRVAREMQRFYHLGNPGVDASRCV